MTQNATTPAASTAVNPNAAKYANINGARPQRGGNPVRPGHYILRIDRYKGEDSFKKGWMNVAEMTVARTFSDSVGGFDFDRKVALASHTAGESVSDVCMKSNVAYEGRVKSFVMVAGNLTQADFDKETAEKRDGNIIATMTGEDQPLAGIFLEVVAKTRIKEKASAKSNEQLTNQDIYTRLDYVRRIPFAELKTILSAEEVARFVPDIDLEIQAEAPAA